MSGPPQPQRPGPTLDQFVESVTTWFNGIFAPPGQQQQQPGAKPVGQLAYGDGGGMQREPSMEGRRYDGNDVGRQWSGKAPSREVSLGQQSTTCTVSGHSSSSGGHEPSQSRGRNMYVADKDDLLDQHVAYYFRHHPEVYYMHSIVRKRPGVYEINGREIQIEWEYATEPGAQGHLVVQDGPLRQPFADYMKMTETNAEYDIHTLNPQAALHMIPMDRRLTFGDQDKAYTRLEAMKVAKEQANFREQAANYMNAGQQVPTDLMTKYEKKINQKLGSSRTRQRSTPRSPQLQQGGNQPMPAAMQQLPPGTPMRSPQHTAASPAQAPVYHQQQQQPGRSVNAFGMPLGAMPTTGQAMSPGGAPYGRW